MKVLVTGAAGFAGRHLIQRLRQSGHRVAGCVAPGTLAEAREVLGEELELHEVDARDGDRARSCVAAERPEGIVHLAGISHVGESWQRRRLTFETNTLGALNVLEAARALTPPPRVLLVGSAEAYGLVPEAHQPISEDRLLRPRSPYGVSKAAAELLGIQAHLGDGVPVVLARPFNHIGQGQAQSFAIADFARQVAAIEAGLEEPVLRVGNLAVRRDFSDVRDMVRAYELLLLRGRLGEPYNIASGRAVALDEVVEGLQKLARVSFEVRPESERMRPVDVPLLVGSSDKLKREVGWSPAVPLEETLGWILDGWRQSLGG